MKPNNFVKNTAACLLVLFSISLSYYQTHAKNVQPDQEKVLSEKDKEAIKHAAGKILHNAIKLYEKESYWDSAQELIVLLDYYPTYNKTDQVIYYLAQCLFEEELTTASVRLNRYLLKKFPSSSLMAASLLSIQKAFYHQQKYKDALRFYYVILKKAAHDDNILSIARYFAGQSHFHLKNYDTAINIMKKINKNSEHYDSAIYTVALCYLKKSNVATSIDYFKEIISLPVISSERRNIIDNSRLTLGFMYYELKYFKPAIELFLDISKKHETYQDCLLGLGWSYTRLEDYDNTIKYLNKLIKKFPKSANTEEAYFLLGQSYIALTKYDEAIKAYGTIVKLFPEKHNLPNLVKKVNNSISKEENRVEKLKVRILLEETKLLDHLHIHDGNKNTPKYIVEEKKKIKNFKENMIDILLKERDSILLMQNTIDSLKKLAERRERRKDWRGYAEYGISRALFLKNVNKTHGN